MYERDPVSVAWDSAAVRMLSQARRARGQWVASRLTDPSQRHVTRFAGISLLGPDPVERGGLNARTRWGRGFVRALYYHNRGGRPVEVQIGRHFPSSGMRPAFRPVRVRVRRAGQAADRAVHRKPLSQRIYNPDGSKGARAAYGDGLSPSQWADW